VELGAGAWSLEQGSLERDPRGNQVSNILFFARKKNEEEGDAIAFFFFVQRKKKKEEEGDGRCLLLPAVELTKSSELRCNAALHEELGAAALGVTAQLHELLGDALQAFLLSELFPLFQNPLSSVPLSFSVSLCFVGVFSFPAAAVAVMSTRP
jgi:hypothetical protein